MVLLYARKHLLCFSALLATALAVPHIWIEPEYRTDIDYHVFQKTKHVKEAVEDVDKVMKGELSVLAEDLKAILDDDDSWTKLNKVKKHLDVGKSVLEQGTSLASFEEWYTTGIAKDGVAILVSDSHLIRDAWPDQPDWVFDETTGVVRHVNDIGVQIFNPDFQGNQPMAILNQDPDRSEEAKDRGENMAIGAKAMQHWTKQPSDPMSEASFWELVTDKEKYGAEPYNAAPVEGPDHDPKKLTPVDLALYGIQHTILHEFYHAKPFGALTHGEGTSGGWQAVIHGKVDQEVAKEDHPDVVAIIVDVVQIHRKGYRVKVSTGEIEENK